MRDFYDFEGTEKKEGVMSVSAKVELFSREELQEIVKKANNQGGMVNDIRWKRAFRRLAEASDCVDAMMGRAEKDK